MSILELVAVLYQGAGYLARLLFYLCFWSVVGPIFLVIGLFDIEHGKESWTMAKKGYKSFVVDGKFPDLTDGCDMM